MNAITALNGIPAAINERPMGIAAYVGSGEASPISAAEAMEMNSFLDETCIFFVRAYLLAAMFSIILTSK